jgi:hypothetical protein
MLLSLSTSAYARRWEWAYLSSQPRRTPGGGRTWSGCGLTLIHIDTQPRRTPGGGATYSTQPRRTPGGGYEQSPYPITSQAHECIRTELAEYPRGGIGCIRTEPTKPRRDVIAVSLGCIRTEPETRTTTHHSTQATWVYPYGAHLSHERLSFVTGDTPVSRGDDSSNPQDAQTSRR